MDDSPAYFEELRMRYALMTRAERAAYLRSNPDYLREKRWLRDENRRLTKRAKQEKRARRHEERRARRCGETRSSGDGLQPTLVPIEVMYARYLEVTGRG